MKTKFWVPKYKCLLFSKIKEVFGHRSEWPEGSDRYPIGKENEFRKLINNMSIMFSHIMSRNITTGAVLSQYNWGATLQRKIKGKNHTSAYILNKAAAYNGGFLQNKDFPDEILIRHNAQDKEITKRYNMKCRNEYPDDDVVLPIAYEHGEWVKWEDIKDKIVE